MLASNGIKRDGRSFDHRTLEAIRLMAVERVGSGEPPSAVIVSYGLNRTTIYTMDQSGGIARRGDGGASGKAHNWAATQFDAAPGATGVSLGERQGPRQYSLDFGLWTRSVVADLIAQKFCIRLGLTAVGELLAKLGLTPQKPLQRACQRDPEAIEKWRRESFPRIAREAKEAGGEVYFWDESGFRADAMHGKTWGVKGQTPVVERLGQRQSISAASR